MIGLLNKKHSRVRLARYFSPPGISVIYVINNQLIDG